MSPSKVKTPEETAEELMVGYGHCVNDAPCKHCIAAAIRWAVEENSKMWHEAVQKSQHGITHDDQCPCTPLRELMENFKWPPKSSRTGSKSSLGWRSLPTSCSSPLSSRKESNMGNDSVPVTMYGRPQHDTRAIKAGAVEYVTCPACGAAPGEACKFSSGGPVPNFAHISRRWEYIEGRGIFFREPTAIPPEIWLRCKQGRHAECKPHPPECKCHPPDPCECECHEKSTSNVDDLLG